MRIAQIAPLWESVPPPAYGGTESVVSLLTDELVRRGHEVTLFASGDSTSLANLEAVCPRALRQTVVEEYPVYEMLLLGQVYQQAHKFDLIHSHIGCAALPIAPMVKVPTLHTLHGDFSSDNIKLFTFAAQQPYISISNSQRVPAPELNYIATVYNGINTNTHPFHPHPENPSYLAFLGRLSPEKGVHLAIEIAQRSGLPLKMAGKIDPIHMDYFETAIRPHIDGKQIQFLGEANHCEKNILMGGAIATLFPITWQEPFGLVMIESMVAGTPVIAMNRGSAPEVIAHGKTGFVCDTVEECLTALARVPQLDRKICREHVVQNFGVARMVDGYEAVYQQLLSKRFAQNGHFHRATTRLSA
jgi:glycosyltransferase involved in cell wall biosynthesis